MAILDLYSLNGGSGSHNHRYDDITAQVDGIKLNFFTVLPYTPGTLIVLYNGVVYTKNNDFSETGAQEFTLFGSDPFPPEVGYPLIATYEVLI